jgi:hypothetical protein
MADRCTHGLIFDEAAARVLLEGWAPKNDLDFVMGDPAHAEVRRRWPRFNGACACGFVGIAYASEAHYALGDW